MVKLCAKAMLNKDMLSSDDQISMNEVVSQCNVSAGTRMNVMGLSICRARGLSLRSKHVTVTMCVCCCSGACWGGR